MQKLHGAKSQTRGARNDNSRVTARLVLIAAVPKIIESRFCGACMPKYAIRSVTVTQAFTIIYNLVPKKPNFFLGSPDILTM